MKSRCLFRALAIWIVSSIALIASAQQTAPQTNGGNQGEQVQSAAKNNDRRVKEIVKVLTDELELTSDQQAKITSILQKQHDAQQIIERDKSLSREDRLAKVKPLHQESNKQIREILTDDQKKKLDEYLKAPHPEVHDNLNGATPAKPAPKN